MAENFEYLNNSCFLVGYEEFLRRSTHDESFHKFVKENAAELDLNTVTSCVSVGAGKGLSELVYINAAMPNLNNLHVVEPNKNSFRKLHENIGQMAPIDGGQNISTHFYLQTFEDWMGPPDKVDLIILSQVLYYLKDPGKVLLRCVNWLKEGGLLWVIIDDSNCLARKLEFEVFQANNIAYAKEPYPVIAEAAGLQLIKEWRVDYEVDYSNPNWEFLSYFVRSNTTQKNFKKFKDSINEYFKGYDKHIERATILSLMFIKN